SQKAGDHSVPLVGPTNTHLDEGEKNTGQATITQLFQRKQQKDAANTNLNKQPTIPETTIHETTTSIPPSTITTTTLIIPTTLSFQSPFLISPLKTTPQTEGEQVRGKGKKAMSHEEVAKEEFDSNSDAKSRPLGSLEES
ncbi:hypothetical protein Tco_1257865, partial [Tanacetum coccineum]